MTQVVGITSWNLFGSRLTSLYSTTCGHVALGEEVLIIGRLGSREVTTDERGGKLGKVDYRVVTRIADLVSRAAV